MVAGTACRRAFAEFGTLAEAAPTHSGGPRFLQALCEYELPIVSIVVPFFGLTKSILSILTGYPQRGTIMETIGKLLVWALVSVYSYSEDS